MCLFSQTTFILEVLNCIRYIFEAFESPDLNTAKLKKVCRPDRILILLVSQLSLKMLNQLLQVSWLKMTELGLDFRIASTLTLLPKLS